jgi:pimeloyl-ACP methyl ester carboxylesterase
MKTNNTTNIYRHGKGKPLYVINGGPGLEYSYLREFFLPLKNEREVVFYDQIGTGKDFDMSIQVTGDDLTCQLVDLLKNDGRSKDVVAHSWGTYLALVALTDRDVNSSVDKVILINPFALDYGRYEHSGQRLFSRFPQSVLDQVGELATENTKDSYLRMIKLIAPYYAHKPDKCYEFNFESYNSPMEEGAYGSIAGFNLVPLLPQIKGEIYVIKCDDDFISLEDTVELQNIAKKHVVLSECGHFPFVEQKDACYSNFVEFLV